MLWSEHVQSVWAKYRATNSPGSGHADPLSAVDAHVGQALFEQCICGALRGKTVLLVTNALHYVHRADNLVWLVNGEIRKQGSYEDVSSDAEFHDMIGGHVVAEETGGGAAKQDGKDGAKQGPLANMNVGDTKKKGLTGAVLFMQFSRAQLLRLTVFIC